MSVIAWDGTTLAADRRATRSSGRIGLTTKIWKCGNCLIGGAGNPDFIQEWIYWWHDQGAAPEKFPANCRGVDYPEMLVIRQDLSITSYERTPFPITWHQKQFAIGSGAHYAITAMHLGRTAREAVEIACLFDSGCGNGVDELSFQDKAVQGIATEDEKTRLKERHTD